ncbi:hypothetical protein C1645_824565 [Glomus cerebriforme]|uniref:Uncharacterized protein n=1 Tax=Glomus cerebriforme TaxID=658196 RepID=A0A397T070_9GLOM|nr:hypothetical protein C1645_824565 [Glomus cerebriforme]
MGREMVLRALQSKMERENGFLSSSVQNGKGNSSLCFWFDTGIRNDSPSVWALGIRKWFALGFEN